MRLDRDVFQEGPLVTFGESERGARAAFFGALHAIGGFGAGVWNEDPDLMRHDYREDNDRYEPAFDVWRACMDLPAPRRFGLAGFVIGNEVHVTGGQGQPPAGVLRDHNVYRPITDSWVDRASLLDLPDGGMGARFLHAGFAIDGVGYVCGGRQPGGNAPGATEAYVEEFDVWETRDDMADHVGEHAAMEAHDLGWSFGGSTGGPTPPILRTTQRYNPESDLWYGGLTVMLEPGRRELCGAKVGRETAMHEHCMIFGGHSDTGDMQTTYTDRYEPASDSWDRRTELPYPARHWSSSAGIEDSAYVVGGEGEIIVSDDPPYNEWLRDCDEYNNLTDSWKQRSPLTDSGHGRLEVLSVTV